MRHLMLSLCLCAMTGTAHADVARAVSDHIIPAFDRFAAATGTLADSARTDCTATAMRPAYHDAFDAWMGISHLQFGPLETGGRNMSIAFWPDTRGMTPRAVAALIDNQDPAIDDPASFAEVSVAGRGLFALEGLLYDDTPSDYSADSYECRLVTAMATDLARVGQEMQKEWQDHAAALNSAGAAGNSTYLSRREATQELYTALMSGLEFDKDMRVGRPVGTFERPRPNRAEAWRSGRSVANVTLSLQSLRDLARALADDDIPRTEAAFQAALDAAAATDDPIFATVSNPQGWLKAEVLAQKIGFIQDAITAEIGSALGVAAGFNSQDGD